MLSEVFVDNGDTTSVKDQMQFYPQTPVNVTGTSWKARNANISYALCGYGIFNPQHVPCITVEAYYNYEIIVHEDQLPFFRPTVQKMDITKVQQITKVAQSVATSVGSITTTKAHENPSTLQRIKQALVEGYKLAEPYLPLIKMGLSLF
jgi:hypothetical protein